MSQQGLEPSASHRLNLIVLTKIGLIRWGSPYHFAVCGTFKKRYESICP